MTFSLDENLMNTSEALGLPLRATTWGNLPSPLQPVSIFKDSIGLETLSRDNNVLGEEEVVLLVVLPF